MLTEDPLDLQFNLNSRDMDPAIEASAHCWLAETLGTLGRV